MKRLINYIKNLFGANKKHRTKDCGWVMGGYNLLEYDSLTKKRHKATIRANCHNNIDCVHTFHVEISSFFE